MTTITPAYKLLALDMDGTLLRGDQSISPDNQRWIAKAIEAGVVVMLATGRGLLSVQHYQEMLQLTTPMVLVNGADVWKSPGDLLERHFLDDDAVPRLHALAQKASTGFWAYGPDKLARQDDWTDDMAQLPWLKFGINSPDVQLIGELRKKIEAWDEYEVTSSNYTNIEVGPKGISKSTGVQAVCDWLGITMKDVMAVGDSPNDLVMLKDVGLGVAMDNAMEEIKHVADVMTTSNEDDGVAVAIQRYLLNGEA